MKIASLSVRSRPRKVKRRVRTLLVAVLYGSGSYNIDR